MSDDRKEHVYMWFGHTTCKCAGCGKILKDEDAEVDDSQCEGMSKHNDENNLES